MHGKNAQHIWRPAGIRRVVGGGGAPGWEWGWGCDPYGVSWEAVRSHAKKLHKGAKGKSVELNFSAQLKRQSGTRKKIRETIHRRSLEYPSEIELF